MITIINIAINELIKKGYEDPKELAKQLKVTVATIKRDLEALKDMNEDDLTFQTKTTSIEMSNKKDTILRMLDNEEYYNEKGDINISKIMEELKTTRSTVLKVLNGE